MISPGNLLKGFLRNVFCYPSSSSLAFTMTHQKRRREKNNFIMMDTIFFAVNFNSFISKDLKGNISTFVSYDECSQNIADSWPFN